MKVTKRIRKEHEKLMADVTNEKRNQKNFQEALKYLRNPR